MESPQEASAALARTLAGDGRCGAVLTGEAGDRRETIEAAIASLPAGRPPYRLHGSDFTAATPYGALAILLSSLQGEQPTTPHGMLQTLSRFLHPEGEEPAMVIVSQADRIDSGAITVLAQLVQRGGIRLVVHADRLTDLPADIAALLRGGLLDGIAVRPLTPTASEDFMEDLLEAPLSRFAATVLWRHSGGSVHRLREVVREAVDSGKLRRTSACWVLAPGALPRLVSGGGVSASLRQLTGRQRSLLEMLAVCGPLAVSDLIHVGYAHELDALQGDGSLRIRADHSGRFAELSPVQAAEILAAIEPDRRRELSTMLQSLDPEFHGVLRAAHELVMIGDAAGAVGLFDEAGRGSAALAEAVNDTAWTHLAWAETHARAAAGDLSGAASVISRSPVAGSATLSVLAACVAISQGDVREAHGRLDQMPAEGLPELLAPRGSSFTGESLRCRAQALRAEALALGDDQDGALRLLGRLEEELSRLHAAGIIDDVISPADRSVLAQSMLDVLFLCGQFAKCRDLAEAVIAGHHANPIASQYAELVLAALEATTGERDLARARVLPLVSQLEVLGNPHELQVARAILVFCSDPDDVETPGMLEAFLDRRPEATEDQPLGRMGWLAELMLAGAAGAVHSPAARTARIMALADRAAEAGLYAIEFSALASAFQFGELRVAGRLAEASAGTQTAISQPNLLLARAVLEDDPELTVRALEGFAEAGYCAHFEPQSPLLKDVPLHVLRRIEDGSTAARRAAETGSRGGGSDPEWMEQLTRREREVTRLVVGGKANSVIARITGISVRTVEGHLYQVYAKLHVGGREELKRLASAQADLRAGR